MPCDNHLLIVAVSTAQVVRLIVWSGLVIATVTLLVLMRTRWGQSQPLKKCIVLSMLVHLLFGIYTTTVNLVVGSIGKPADSPMWVALQDGDSLEEDSSESEVDEGDSRWNQLVGDTSLLEERVALPQLREELLTGESSQKLPDVSAAVLDRALEKTTKSSEVPEHATPSVQTVAAKAAEIESTNSAPAQQPVEPAEIDKVASPDRFRVDRAAEDAALGPTDLPRDPLKSTAELAPSRKEHDELRPGAMQAEGIAAKPAGAGATGSGEGWDGALVPVSGSGIEGGEGGAEAKVPTVMRGRVASDRLRRAIANGGSEDTEAAVIAALEWLAKHQSDNGRWDPDHFEAGRGTMIEGHDRPGAGSHADTGITGLALLAFLAHGNTHTGGEHPQTVQRGLEYLLSVQAADGNLCGNATVFERMYCHAMATCAISEAYAMTKDQRLEAPVKRAIAYCVRAQDRVGGGWRYRPGDAGDTSQLGWQVMALKSAELAGIAIPSDTRSGITRFLTNVAQGQNGGLACYKPGHRVTHTMTAEALVCRQFLGITDSRAKSAEAGNFVLTDLPGQGTDNVYYWYYGTLGMFQLQGSHWEQWNKSLQTALLTTQRIDGEQRGSWDPDRVWGSYGGRVYSTALSTLCLEVYYRFLPLYVEAANRDTQ